MTKFHDTEMLNEIPILEVACMLGLSIKHGKSLCFLHTEKTPSLSFNIRKNFWHCFGCGESGSVIDLVIRKEQIGFQEACMWLEQRFSVGNASYKGIPQQLPHRRNILKQSEKATDEPDSDLYTEIINQLYLSEKARSYLCDSRALSQDVIKAHSIVSLEEISSFHSWLKKSYDMDRLIKAGVFGRNDIGLTYCYWQKPGILFPYYNIHGRIVNLQIRPYQALKKQKYMFLYGAKTCMFNENRLSYLPQGANVFLCEGAIDTLSMLTMKKVAVGLPGATTLKEEWITMLSRFQVIIILDNDETGQKRAKIYENILKGRNINVQRYDLKKYKDVNEILVAERGKKI